RDGEWCRRSGAVARLRGAGRGLQADGRQVRVRRVVLRTQPLSPACGPRRSLATVVDGRGDDDGELRLSVHQVQHLERGEDADVGPDDEGSLEEEVLLPERR